MCSTLRRNGPGRGRAGANEVTLRAPQILRLRQSGLLPQPARPFPQNLQPLNLNRDRNRHSIGAVLPPQSPKGSPSKAVVKLNLRIHRAVCDVHMNRALLVERYGIHETVVALHRKDGAVLDREFDREFEPSLAPALKTSFRGVDAPRGSIAPRRRAQRLMSSNRSGLGTPSPPLGTGHINNPRYERWCWNDV